MSFRRGMAARQLILEEQVGVLVRADAQQEDDEFATSADALRREQQRHL